MNNAEQNEQKGFEIEWFRVECTSCGWSWFESSEYRTARFFYCPKCLSKVENSKKKQKRQEVANEADIVSLKKYFDRIRLDNRS